MKNITLTIANIDRLNSIQKSLTDNQAISEVDSLFLSDFLSQIPPTARLASSAIGFDEDLVVDIWEIDKSNGCLDKWKKLLDNLPGWDYCPFSFLVDDDTPELLQNNVVICARFAPSYSYNLLTSSENRAYEIWLKDDGMAEFWLPTYKDAKSFPDLFNFKGTWQQAYLLLIETLKKGWPTEEFPEELRPLLKK